MKRARDIAIGIARVPLAAVLTAWMFAEAWWERERWGRRINERTRR